MIVHHDRAAGVVLVLLSAATLAYAFTFPDEAGLYVKLISGIMTVLSLGLWARSFSASEREKTFDIFFPHAKGLAVIVGASLIYFIAAELVGFYSASAVFVPAAAVLAGLRRSKTIAIGTVIYLGFVFVVFGLIFNKDVTPELILTMFR